MKVLRSKKGAALVAVLIGILFISILASSLLYMSTMNYQMKSMRQFSADNFYSAEFALDDMLAQINQYASIKTTPLTDLDAYLKNPTQVDGKTVFNETHLRDMIKVDTYVTGIDSIEVTSIYKNGTTYTRDTYKKSSNYIYLYGVQIIVTTDDAHGNYVSTITTDIALGFPQQSGGTAGLNDFSVLMDSPIYVNGGSPNFCSDVYARANKYSQGSLSMGRDALRVGNASDGGICSLLGQFSFLQGDVTVKNGASLLFGGDCYINGDLNIEGSGQVIVSGRVYIRGDVKLSGGAKAPIISGGTITKDQEQRTGDNWDPSTNKNNTKVKWSDYDTKYGTGLAGQLVASQIKLHFASLGDKTLTQEEFWNYICGGGNTGNGLLATSKTNPNVHAWYLTNGVSHGFKNTLIVSANSPTSYHGAAENSTWLITCNNGILQIDGTTDNDLQVWGSMDDNSYELAKTLFFQATPNQNISGHQNTFGGNDGSGKVYGLDDITPDGGGDSTIKYLGSTKLHQYETGNLGADLQPYYYVHGAEDTNLFPYNNFFSDKMEQILSDFKYGLKGNGDPTAKPTIILNNWTKD